jgi:hypothetical protein
MAHIKNIHCDKDGIIGDCVLCKCKKQIEMIKLISDLYGLLKKEKRYGESDSIRNKMKEIGVLL